ASGAILIQENDGNRLEGNFIGTDVTGTQPATGGVFVFASSQNTLGGTAPESRNVISGFSGGFNIIGRCGPATDPVVQLYDTRSNLVQGSYIGTDRNGTTGLGGGGVSVSCAVNNTIGGATPAARNIISGNNGDGVILGGNDGVAGNNRLL